jgi:hypothetical protein
MTMRRVWVAFMVAVTAVSLSAAPKFLDVWKSPEVSRLNFQGKTVAALVLADSQSLQMSGEEALTRELMARGVNGLATYKFVPGPELKSADRAKGWFERRGVQGVVALRPVSQQSEKYAPVVFTSGYYQSFWGYYGYGWTNAYVPIGSRTTTTIVVETLVYDVTRDQLVWAATSQTKNPDTLQEFVKDLVDATVREMKKMKMVG